MQINDCVAVLTGAGSGIGRAVALALASRSCHLAIADINEEGLAETARQARAMGVRVSEHKLDVASREQVAALPQAVIAEHGQVDLLINNAGVALGGHFHQVSEADFDWLMAINFEAVVRMTRAFLPFLQERPAARIVNVSSLFGLVTPAGQTAYCASKFAVRGFSNALRLELQDTSVGVTVVHPGGVATSIATSARVSADVAPEEVERNRKQAQKLLRMPPERAAEIIVAAIERDKPRVLVGNDARILSWLERLLPVNYWRLFPALAKPAAPSNNRP
ncbi:Short-chain dehydrogenase [Halopseudomonas xinjiangensis]|uniref:Short-chain dehydrogenase n=1 Tax=Halopseudomonas xinjiangensis TaxID=487184 RepID=A0A1H1PHT6_9GAMM|nr:SDR family oxidoreductase [Halopseudomonas xinjiangensis]SDS10683.1 Short-chain dehydrogenase [Halopseudomonas xinjiangensis]